MQKYYFRLVFFHKNLFFSIILVALGTNVNKKKRKVEKKVAKVFEIKNFFIPLHPQSSNKNCLAAKNASIAQLVRAPDC